MAATHRRKRPSVEVPRPNLPNATPAVGPARHGQDDAEVTAGVSTRIILARHGEAAYSSDTGDDVSGGILTELGRSQARALGDQLRSREIVAIVCSDLSRARQTAEIAAQTLDLPVDMRAGLHEYQAGDEPYDVRSLGTALLAWLDGDLDPRILGGESGQEVAQRIRPVLDDLVREHHGKTVLVVIHGGAIIATLGSIAPGYTGLPTDGVPENLEHDIPGGAYFSIEHRQDGWTVLPRAES